MLSLPSLPPSIQLLSNAESQALNLRYPHSVTSLQRCVTCRGAKTFEWFAPGTRSEVVTYECPCKDQYRLARWLWNSGIQRKYQRFDWVDLEKPSQITFEAIFGYLERLDTYVNNGIGLVLTGPRGTGKTLLANLILKDIIGKGVVDCYSTTFSQMIDHFAEGWRDKEQTTWFNRKVRDAGMLFIDDLGRERNKGAGSVGDNMLETVIRHRVACQLPTIITSNIDSDKIGEAYGGHTESLLSECSVVIPVPGTDSREGMHARDLDYITRGLTRPVVL